MADNPGFMNMVGDNVGLPGILAGGSILASKIPGMLARYGASAGGALAGGPVTAGLTAAQVMAPTPANAGEQPFYIRDPKTGQIVPNPANPLVHNAALMKASIPSQAPPQAPPQVPGSAPIVPAGFSGAPSAPASVGGIGSDHSATPWQTATPTPQVPAPSPPPAPPMSLAPPSPGPTAPPPNLYNGPGSASFGAGDVAPGASTGGIPNAANLKTFLNQFLKGSPQPAAAPTQQQGINAGPFGTMQSSNSQIMPALAKLFGGSSGPTNVVGGAGSMPVPTF